MTHDLGRVAINSSNFKIVEGPAEAYVVRAGSVEQERSETVRLCHLLLMTGILQESKIYEKSA
jgi:hypothetical protein